MSDLYWLTDEQMARLEPYFPKSHGKPRVDDRRVLSGIVFVNRNGLRWCDAPREYGPHKTIYNRWKRWGERGVFLRIMEGLAAASATPKMIMIDATYLKVTSPLLWMARPLSETLLCHDSGSFEEGAKVMDVSVLGIDLGKNSCSVVGLDTTGKVVVRRRMRRETVITYAAALPACVVAMEACCGAHHMGRALARQGHSVRLMSPEYVRPYVKAQKNDDRDAEGIAEAATRPTMRFVELKTEEQLDMQTLHRIRDQLVGDRTSLMNQIRSLLLERGYLVPQGRAKLAVRLGEMLDGDEPVLGSRIHRLVSDMRLRWIALDERISDLDAEFTNAARTDERTRRLLTIPGIGALNATALVAAVGDARTFGRGRDLAAWLGLVPRQATTGGKPRLLGITKRGSRYLRKNLIQGARSALPTMSKSDTRLGAWLRGLLSRSHPNTVVVALAAKMARIVWALLRHDRTYDPVAQAA